MGRLLAGVAAVAVGFTLPATAAVVSVGASGFAVQHTYTKQHLVVAMTMPGKALTLRGAMGPFQSQGVDGALSWVLKPAGAQTDLTVTYTLGGYLTLPGGFDALAKAADGMFASQVAHLQKFIDGGG